MLEYRKNYFAEERTERLHEVGVDRPRSDAHGPCHRPHAILCRSQFPGLLHLKMVRSPHHHARIKSIDVSKALKVPGVVRVLTAKDVPSNIYTILCLIQVEPNDEPVLAFDKVRLQGRADRRRPRRDRARRARRRRQGQGRLRRPCRPSSMSRRR